MEKYKESMRHDMHEHLFRGGGRGPHGDDWDDGDLTETLCPRHAKEVAALEMKAGKAINGDDDYGMEDPAGGGVKGAYDESGSEDDADSQAEEASSQQTASDENERAR